MTIMEPLQPKTHHGMLEVFIYALYHSQEDCKASDGHKTPVYNLDFSLLAGLLFNKEIHGTKPFLPPVKGVMNWLLGQHTGSEPYFLAVSGAMYFEFLDYLNHILHSLRYRIPASVDEIMGRQLTQNSVQLIENLSVLTKKGAIDQITHPATQLLHYVNQEVIHGVGDYLARPTGGDIRKIKESFDAIVEAQSRLRLDRDFASSGISG